LLNCWSLSPQFDEFCDAGEGHGVRHDAAEDDDVEDGDDDAVVVVVDDDDDDGEQAMGPKCLDSEAKGFEQMPTMALSLA
jgi:hypothetical protein